MIEIEIKNLRGNDCLSWFSSLHYSPLELVKNRDLTIHDVVSVYANQPELGLIMESFANLPHINGEPSSCRWFGDDAKFIINNLHFVVG